MRETALAQKNVIRVSADVDSYFCNYVVDLLRFALRGPLRLYASSLDEYCGTDTALGRAISLRRIAKLPTGLGQGVYLITGYEAGSIRSQSGTRFFIRTPWAVFSLIRLSVRSRPVERLGTTVTAKSFHFRQGLSVSTTRDQGANMNAAAISAPAAVGVSSVRSARACSKPLSSIEE
jgi:hypothetical protein